MKKIAIFVEGYAEFYFVEKLLVELKGEGRVHFRLARQHSGEVAVLKTSGAPVDCAEIEVMLVNCCSDGAVKPAILERKSRLADQGYTYVIGLQDLYRRRLDEWERFEEGLSSGLEDDSITTVMNLAVMEVEAWFLNEAKHFVKIDPILTRDLIVEKTKFDPVSDRAEIVIRHPSSKLDEIYILAGQRYQKRQDEIKRVIAALDFEEIYEVVRERSKSLSNFLSRLEDAVATPVEAVELG